MTTTGHKKGYLDVKIPAPVRGKGIRGLKAWKKRWVVVHGLTHASTQNPIATLDVYCHESQGHRLERTTIYLEGVRVLRRTPSRSRQFAFSVESDRVLVYLSGNSETDSQQWMAALRGILWPSSTNASLACSIGEVFRVGIIEPLSRVASHIPIGFVVTLPSVVLLAEANTGCISIEWPWSSIANVALAPTTNADDDGKIVVVEISGIANGGLYYFFCEEAEDIYKAFRRRLSPSPADKDPASTAPPANDRPDPSTPWHPPRSDSPSSDEPCSEASDAEIEPVADRRRKNEEPPASSEIEQPFPIGKSHNMSLELIPKRVGKKSPALSSQPLPPLAATRRKSCSDSALADPKCAYGGDPSQSRTSVISDQSNSEYEEISDGVLRNVYREDWPSSSPSATLPGENGLRGAPSFASQLSRDSGVVLCNSEESTPTNPCGGGVPNAANLAEEILGWTRMTKTYDDRRHYRQFTDFVDTSTTTVLEKIQCERMSVASSSTVYSEVDALVSIQQQDPLYEDLDKFRKDIHKLLGITLRSDKPPPLPPRKYGAAQHVRRKDVAKYLGLESGDYYGSPDKPPPTEGTGSRHRKDIHKYLGIPSVANVQTRPSEPTYDSPPSHVLRKVSADESLYGQGRTPRTYVRVKPISPGSSVKPAKKRSISFIRTRKLSTGQKVGDRNTAKSPAPSNAKDLEATIPEDIATPDKDRNNAADKPTGTRAISMSKSQTLPLPMSPRSDFEQYAIPPSHRSSVPFGLGPSPSESNPPVYVNLDDLQSPTEDIEEAAASVFREHRESASREDAEIVGRGELEEPGPIGEESDGDSDDSQYLDMTGTLRRNLAPSAEPTNRRGAHAKDRPVIVDVRLKMDRSHASLLDTLDTDDQPSTAPDASLGAERPNLCGPEAHSDVSPGGLGDVTAVPFERADRDRAMRTKLSCYIDELFEQSMMEYESHDDSKTSE